MINIVPRPDDAAGLINDSAVQLDGEVIITRTEQVGSENSIALRKIAGGPESSCKISILLVINDVDEFVLKNTGER